MTISKDEAQEALASISESQRRLYDIHMADQVMPGLVASGFFGLVGFGLQSSLAELAFGAKILSGWSGTIALFGIMLVPVWFFHQRIRPMRLKPEYNLRHIGATFPLSMTLTFMIMLPGPLPDIASSQANIMFSISTSYPLGAMLWIGRWHAYGALAIILSIALICAYELNPDMRFSWLSLLCGFGILPAGLWMMIEGRRAKV